MLPYRTWGALGFVFSIGFVACSSSESTTNGDGGGDASADAPKMTTDALNPVDRASPPADGRAPDAQNPGDASTTDAPTDTGTTGNGGCAMGQLHCTNGCVDPATDHANCGACGMPCNNNQACVSSMCVQVPCEAGTTLCLGTCVDTQTNTANCGACNSACGKGATCTAGGCVCPTGQMDCPGSGCVNVTTGTSNCGGCGNSCGPGGTCTNSLCSCAMGVTKCGNACADVMTDPNNCGMCGHACMMGSVACSGGMCQTMCDGGPCCAPGYTACPDLGRGGMLQCVQLLTNTSNCGFCGNTCNPDLANACIAGMCI